MTEAERDSGTTAVPARGGTRAVRVAIGLSAALFFLQLTVFAPGDVAAALGFSSHDLGHRWWTIATFTLVHTSAWPLVVNLAVLGIFGTHLERTWGTGEFIRFYLACSLGAWIAHLAFVSSDVVLTGAAAPAIGTLIAFAALNGRERHLRVGAISVSTATLAAGGTMVILAAGIATSAPDVAAAYLVHGGGIVAAWTYLRTASSLNLARLSKGVSPVPDEPEDAPPRAVPRNHPRAQHQDDEIVARSNAAVAREAATRVPPITPQFRDPSHLNRVLDKISRHGLESLTSDERMLLDEMSRRLRDH